MKISRFDVVKRKREKGSLKFKGAKGGKKGT